MIQPKLVRLNLRKLNMIKKEQIKDLEHKIKTHEKQLKDLLNSRGPSSITKALTEAIEKRKELLKDLKNE